MTDNDSDRERNIANVLETYFSDANLTWDKQLQNMVSSDPHGYVSLDKLCKLRRFKTLNAQANEIKRAAEHHSLSKLKLDEEGSRIARIKPFVLNKTKELEDWSIYVEGLRPPHNNESAIKALFHRLVGHVAYVRVPEDWNGSAQFKGYCFVEFTHRDHVDKAVTLLNRYPEQDTSTDATDSEEINKLNLRVMPKTEWLRYETEYLAYRDACRARAKEAWSKLNAETVESTEQVEREGPIKEAVENTFPKGVVVDVMNIHPKSSKTVLKQLLETSGASIEFINYKKGLPRCHVRLATPNDTQKLVDHFDASPVIQEHGTDSKGLPVSAEHSAVFRVREIKGKEEEIYWQHDQQGLAKLKSNTPA